MIGKKKLAKREKHHPLYSGLWYRNHVKYDDWEWKWWLCSSHKRAMLVRWQDGLKKHEKHLRRSIIYMLPDWPSASARWNIAMVLSAKRQALTFLLLLVTVIGRFKGKSLKKLVSMPHKSHVSTTFQSLC